MMFLKSKEYRQIVERIESVDWFNFACAADGIFSYKGFDLDTHKWYEINIIANDIFFPRESFEMLCEKEHIQFFELKSYCVLTDNVDDSICYVNKSLSDATAIQN